VTSPDANISRNNLRISSKKFILRPNVSESNKAVVKTIIVKSCLSSKSSKERRDKLFGLIDRCNSDYFIILFGQKPQLNSSNFQGVYYSDQNGVLRKLFGDNEHSSQIVSSMVQKYFQFNQQFKEFREIVGADGFYSYTDAIVLKPSSFCKLAESRRTDDWLNKKLKSIQNR